MFNHPFKILIIIIIMNKKNSFIHKITMKLTLFHKKINIIMNNKIITIDKQQKTLIIQLILKQQKICNNKIEKIIIFNLMKIFIHKIIIELILNIFKLRMMFILRMVIELILNILKLQKIFSNKIQIITLNLLNKTIIKKILFLIIIISKI